VRKLVRNGIPALVAAKGEREPFRRVINEQEHDQLLDEKFDEELGEWREGFNPKELADLLAVVRDTATRRGIGWEELQKMEQAKRDRYGDFLGGVVWLGYKRQSYDMSDREQAVLNDSELQASLQRGLADAAAGRVRPWSELTHKADQCPDGDRLREEAAQKDSLPCRNCGATLDACFANPPCCRTQGGKKGCLHG
jgi:predicted house-cleaning noncanonical NTP pyrophosphatase (MazG superfamily)